VFLVSALRSSVPMGLSSLRAPCGKYTKRVAMAVYKRMFPKVSGLAAWRENVKCYSSLPLDAVVSLFCGSV
jgi:hypothetical protein